MAEHFTPNESTAPAAGRPLLSALTSWWSPADNATADPVLGYESAQPWMLDDTPADAATPRHD